MLKAARAQGRPMMVTAMMTAADEPCERHPEAAEDNPQKIE